MDLNYDVRSWDVSLETRCAVKLAYQSLLGSGFKMSVSNDYHVIREARSRVAHLCLPLHVKNTVGDLIPQIHKELNIWYNYFNVGIPPVLTAQGTVDWWQSSRNIVDDETVDKRNRYTVACLFCHEEKIFDLHRSMSFDERENVRNQNHVYALSGSFKRFTDLWLHETTQPDRQMDYTGGLVTAITHDNGHAMKFFINKVTSEVAAQIVNHELTLGNIMFCDERPLMSPETYCLMYSILGKEHQLSGLSEFSHLMLDSLFIWPYQRLFVTAAQSLITHLSIDAYWDILNKIVQAITSERNDHDYMDMYIKFWDIGANFIGDKHFVREYCPEMFDNILCSHNRVLINHLLIEISDKGRNMLLRYFVEERISYVSVREHAARYQFLDIFIRSCSMKRKDTLLKFKEDFLRNFNSRPVINAAMRNCELEIINNFVGEILEELQLEQTMVSHSASLNRLTPSLIEKWFHHLYLSEIFMREFGQPFSRLLPFH